MVKETSYIDFKSPVQWGGVSHNVVCVLNVVFFFYLGRASYATTAILDGIIQGTYGFILYKVSPKIIA